MKTLLAIAMLASCGGMSGDDTSSFDGVCDGSAASCGQITVRWTIAKPTGSATCATVDATTVRVTATYQADHRVATFSATCDTAAILTSKLPLGPYALQVDVLDATNAMLDTRAANATLGIAGSITEADVAFVVMPQIRPGELFGACSSAQPCTGSLVCVPTSSTAGLCSNPCDNGNTTETMACTAAAKDAGAPNQALCAVPYGVTDPSQLFCELACGTASEPCPNGTRCDMTQMFGPVCVPS